MFTVWYESVTAGRWEVLDRGLTKKQADRILQLIKEDTRKSNIAIKVLEDGKDPNAVQEGT